ncbi:MAG: GGDEF domain-containing protein [Spirochaetaceae bacterium]|jgi:diguanylate cyclase (GGDEF)-like protein|nr:GGDEF domain-containing protein [Spirochaetaceae bacterium]
MDLKAGSVSCRVISLAEKWRYNGFNKNSINSCSAAINTHNASALSIASLATALMILFLLFYPGGAGHIDGVYYMFAAIQFVIFVYSLALARGRIPHTWGYVLGIMFFTSNILCFSLYVCIFDQGIYTMRFLLFFLSIEIIFIFGALLNLLYNIFIVAAFFTAYKFSDALFGVTMPQNSQYDLRNIAISSLIAAIMNWYISFVFIKGIITSLSLQEERNRYHEESIHDQLTGLNNRRSFEQSVKFYTSVCRHVHQTVCIIMMDIDFFKNYNDHYGHHKGDLVLQAIGSVLQCLIDEEKVYAARVGGEEFIVMWTENRTAEAERVALKLRQMILNLKIPHSMSKVSPWISASLGLYIMRGGSEDSTEKLYNAADSALYKAKAAGRNCVIRLDSADDSYSTVEIRDFTEASR